MPRNKKQPNKQTHRKSRNLFDALQHDMSSDSESITSASQADLTASQRQTRSQAASVDTPDLSQMSEKQLLLKLTTDLTAVTTDLRAVKTDVSEIKSSLEFSSNEITTLKTDNAQLNRQVRDQSMRIDMLNEKIEVLERRQTSNEQYTRKYNLILDCLPEEQNENLEDRVLAIFTNTMNIHGDILIDNIHRLPGRPGGIKPVIVRFVRCMDRDRVWAAKSKLRNTNIFIREHLSTDVAARQRELLPMFKALKAKGETVVLARDSISYNRRQYSTSNVTRLYPVLGTTDPCATIDDVYAYFGRHSPLSNFHKCKFEYEGKEYSCVEEAYQEQKAVAHDREDLAYRITHSNDPVEMKRHGDALDNRQWYESGEAVRTMTSVVRAKFTQCQRPREFLQNTKEKPIAEASPTDKFWGIGLSRFNKDSQNTTKWVGKNNMGLILQKIRDEIKVVQ